MERCCMEIAHTCVYALCGNHAVYSHSDISDNYCYTHMVETLKEGGWNSEKWWEAGWYKIRCRRKQYGAKKHAELVRKELAKTDSPIPPAPKVAGILG